MSLMPVVTTDYLDVIEHLPSGAVLRFDQVPWEEYDQLLAELGEGSPVRVFYDDGRMEIMAPSSPHEKSKGLINRLVNAIADELSIDIESLGSTTFRSQLKAKGAEPDECFYVQNAASVIGREVELDIQRDPPPDIVVEIERTSASLDKFRIYSALGVPEIWREQKKRVRFFTLVQGGYVESSHSRAFPFLDSATFSEFLARGFAEGSRKSARAFRARLRELRPGA